MPCLIAHLSKSEQRTLLAEINYLNLGEMRSFCREHAIPTVIFVATASGERKRSKDIDRKSIVLDRVRRYLKTGRVPEATCFRASIVRLEGPPQKLRPTDRLYYGWYDKHKPSVRPCFRICPRVRFPWPPIRHPS